MTHLRSFTNYFQNGNISIIIITTLLLFTKCFSGGEKTTQISGADSTAINLNAKSVAPNSNKTLTISGEKIWVREEPSNGRVIMKLNNGDTCIILEKGYAEEIKGQIDYWYKISCKGDTGWVFGSQTNMKTDDYYGKTKNEIDNGIPGEQDFDFENFIEVFFPILSDSNSLKQYVHADLGLFQAYNPGAMCIPNSISIYQIKLPEKTDLPVHQGIPDGDLCFGFSGVADGYYYEQTNEIPSYPEFDQNNEVVLSPVNVPEQKIDNVVKMILIENEMTVMTFYYAFISGRWYLFGQDICDCSA